MVTIHSYTEKGNSTLGIDVFFFLPHLHCHTNQNHFLIDSAALLCDCLTSGGCGRGAQPRLPRISRRCHAIYFFRRACVRFCLCSSTWDSLNVRVGACVGGGVGGFEEGREVAGVFAGWPSVSHGPGALGWTLFLSCDWPTLRHCLETR